MENGIMKSSSERVEKGSARGRSERQIPETARQNQKIIAKPANGRHYWTVQLRVAAFVDKRRYNGEGCKSEANATLVSQSRLVPRTIL
jgi:hypothetical protein